jgi:hypothetical protein
MTANGTVNIVPSKNAYRMCSLAIAARVTRTRGIREKRFGPENILDSRILTGEAALDANPGSNYNPAACVLTASAPLPSCAVDAVAITKARST